MDINLHLLHSFSLIMAYCVNINGKVVVESNTYSMRWFTGRLYVKYL